MESAQRLDIGTQPRRTRWALPWKCKPSRKTVLIALAALAIAGGLFFGWGWVAAAGLSSVVLGLLPCAAMCAAGVWLNRIGQKNACGGSGETTVAKQLDAVEMKALDEFNRTA